MESQHKGSSSVFLGSLFVNVWEKGWCQWVIFSGWVQCFEFPSVLWYHLLDVSKSIWPIKYFWAMTAIPTSYLWGLVEKENWWVLAYLQNSPAIKTEELVDVWKFWCVCDCRLLKWTDTSKCMWLFEAKFSEFSAKFSSSE